MRAAEGGRPYGMVVEHGRGIPGRGKPRPYGDGHAGGAPVGDGVLDVPCWFRTAP